MQFLVEKIINSIEFSNPFENPIEKKTEIIETVESNYKISRRVSQARFTDIADSFIEYIHSLDPNKIQEREDDLKCNGWEVKSLLGVENACELLTAFQMFYYLNGRFPLTNGLLIFSDAEVPEGTDKINLKLLYEMFKATNSYGIVSVQFLGALAIFLGVDISVPENAITITKLNKSLSYET